MNATYINADIVMFSTDMCMSSPALFLGCGGASCGPWLCVCLGGWGNVNVHTERVRLLFELTAVAPVGKPKFCLPEDFPIPKVEHVVTGHLRNGKPITQMFVVNCNPKKEGPIGPAWCVKPSVDFRAAQWTELHLCPLFTPPPALGLQGPRV